MSLHICTVRFMYPFKLFLSNRILESKPSTNAFLRTTTAVTQFNAGVKVCVSAVDTYVDYSTEQVFHGRAQRVKQRDKPLASLAICTRL